MNFEFQHLKEDIIDFGFSGGGGGKKKKDLDAYIDGAMKGVEKAVDQAMDQVDSALNGVDEIMNMATRKYKSSYGARYAGDYSGKGAGVNSEEIDAENKKRMDDFMAKKEAARKIAQQEKEENARLERERIQRAHDKKMKEEREKKQRQKELNEAHARQKQKEADAWMQVAEHLNRKHSWFQVHYAEPTVEFDIYNLEKYAIVKFQYLEGKSGYSKDSKIPEGFCEYWAYIDQNDSFLIFENASGIGIVAKEDLYNSPNEYSAYSFKDYSRHSIGINKMRVSYATPKDIKPDWKDSFTNKGCYPLMKRHKNYYNAI